MFCSYFTEKAQMLIPTSGKGPLQFKICKGLEAMFLLGPMLSKYQVCKKHYGIFTIFFFFFKYATVN